MTDTLHVCIASRSGKAAYASLLCILDCAYYMGKKAAKFHIIRTNWLEWARKRAVDEAFESEGHPTSLRGLQIDDDVIIQSQPQELAKIFLDADKGNYSVVGTYQTANRKNMIARTDYEKDRLTDEEIAALPELTPLKDYVYGGMGFVYGDLPLGYSWTETSEEDEGSRYFREHRDMPIYLDRRIRLHSGYF